MRRFVNPYNVTNFFLIAALAFSCFYLFKTATIRHIAKAQTLVSPFVLRYEYYSFDREPAGRLVKEETVARRSDGAMVEAETAGPLSWGVWVRMITYPDGRSVTLHDAIKGKATWPALPKSAVAALTARMAHPPENCVYPGETLVKQQDTVLGHQVSVVSKAPPGLSRITEWRAPELGCTRLQYRAESPQPDGSWKLDIEARAVSLELTEPDPKLFDQGKEYAELKPSELERRELERAGVREVPEEMQKSWEDIDKAYLGIPERLNK